MDKCYRLIRPAKNVVFRDHLEFTDEFGGLNIAKSNK